MGLHKQTVSEGRAFGRFCCTETVGEVNGTTIRIQSLGNTVVLHKVIQLFRVTL